MSDFNFILEEAKTYGTLVRISDDMHRKLNILSASLHTSQHLLVSYLLHKGFEHTTREELQRLAADRKRFSVERRAKWKAEGKTPWFTDHVVCPVLPPLKNWGDLEKLPPEPVGEKKERNELVNRYKRSYPNLTLSDMAEAFHISRERVRQILHKTTPKDTP